MNANTWTRSQASPQTFASPFVIASWLLLLANNVYIYLTEPGQSGFLCPGSGSDTASQATDPEQFPSGMRQGNFSELLGPNLFYSSHQAESTIPQPAPRFGAASCTPFPNNLHSMAEAEANPNSHHRRINADARLLERESELRIALPKPASYPAQRKETLSSDFLLSDKDRIQFRHEALFTSISPFSQGSGPHSPDSSASPGTDQLGNLDRTINGDG